MLYPKDLPLISPIDVASTNVPAQAKGLRMGHQPPRFAPPGSHGMFGENQGGRPGEWGCLWNDTWWYMHGIWWYLIYDDIWWDMMRYDDMMINDVWWYMIYDVWYMISDLIWDHIRHDISYDLIWYKSNHMDIWYQCFLWSPAIMVPAVTFLLQLAHPVRWIDPRMTSIFSPEMVPLVSVTWIWSFPTFETLRCNFPPESQGFSWLFHIPWANPGATGKGQTGEDYAGAAGGQHGGGSVRNSSAR